ncbi:hypothetical protein RJ639_000234 [Escallonia herrerae]|uniref:BHLH domain-containing protein n=1 Tax=Escallonia herrerae TaxID=1293975 RepID=A0AA89BHG9_9ASTE|nr:hypothetical protein RJ639_000234 [Escallonia herrerae]
MAAFSYQHHPFLLESVYLPNPHSKMSGFLEEPNNTTTFFPQFQQPDPLQGTSPMDVSVHQSSCLEHDTKVVVSYNEPSVTNSPDSSSVVLDKIECSEQVTQRVIPMDKKRKHKDGTSPNSAQSKDTRGAKPKKQRKCNGTVKDAEEKKAGAYKKDEKKVTEEAPTGYIHVRARRGQATDSHSLAERVRREKISERMKLLQALVPGCDKVTGKALMLDEIINYVQSLQNQVEFLSMKLASVNPMFYDFGLDLDSFMVKPERLGSLASPLPNVQQCSPSTTNTFTTANNYPLLDSPTSLLFQQGQMQNILSQSNGQLLWDVDGERQKIISQSGFSTNLCSFH